MYPSQTEMLAKLVIDDRHREAARLRTARSIRRRSTPTTRSRIGGLLVATGLALQGVSRAQRGMVRRQVDYPQLATDPC